MEQGLCQDSLCRGGEAANHSSAETKNVEAKLRHRGQEYPPDYRDQRRPYAPLEVLAPDQPLKNDCITKRTITSEKSSTTPQ